MHPQRVVEAEGVRQRQTRPQPGLHEQAVAVKRHQARLRPDQMRRGLQQNLPLPDVLADPREVQRAQRPEAAERQAAAPRDRARTEVFRLKQGHRQSALRRVPCDPRPEQPAADHDQIKSLRKFMPLVYQFGGFLTFSLYCGGIVGFANTLPPGRKGNPL